MQLTQEERASDPDGPEGCVDHPKAECDAAPRGCPMDGTPYIGRRGKEGPEEQRGDAARDGLDDVVGHRCSAASIDMLTHTLNPSARQC